MRITRSRGQCNAQPPSPTAKVARSCAARIPCRAARALSGVRRCALGAAQPPLLARPRAIQRVGCAAQSLKTAGAYKKRAAESAKEGDFDMAAADLLRALMRPVRPSRRILCRPGRARRRPSPLVATPSPRRRLRSTYSRWRTPARYPARCFMAAARSVDRVRRVRAVWHNPTCNECRLCRARAARCDLSVAHRVAFGTGSRRGRDAAAHVQTA